MQYRIFVFCLLWALPFSLFAQNWVVLDGFEFAGNKRTKGSYLIKLLPWNKGDTLHPADLDGLENRCEKTFRNTKLFDSVSVTSNINGNHLTIKASLKERWYFYPIPYLAIADRNFNEWWVDRNHNLRRLVVGGAITQKNLSGRNDELYVSAWVGFENRVIVNYQLPYLQHSNRWGIDLHAEWVENKNLAVNTRENRLIYWKGENSLRTASAYSLHINYQPQFLNRHQFSAGVLNYHISDSVYEENPEYLGIDLSQARYPFIEYSYLLDRRNYRGYPTSGYLFGLETTHYFVGTTGISKARIRLNYHLTWGKYHASSQSLLYVSSPTFQPYVLQKGFGWQNDLVRGYNYHVIEGEHYWIQKLSLARKLPSISSHFDWLPQQLSHLSVTPIPKLFFDAGYVVSRQFSGNGYLHNQLLWGTGVGLDLLTYYDNIWRVEYTVNNMKETGLFLNFTLFIQ